MTCVFKKKFIRSGTNSRFESDWLFSFNGWAWSLHINVPLQDRFDHKCFYGNYLPSELILLHLFCLSNITMYPWPHNRHLSQLHVIKYYLTCGFSKTTSQGHFLIWLSVVKEIFTNNPVSLHGLVVARVPYTLDKTTGL